MTDRKCVHMTAEMARNCHVCNPHQMPAYALEAEQCAVVKPLEWVKRDVWYAECPLAQSEHTVFFEEGKWWTNDLSLPSFESEHDAMISVDKMRAKLIASFITIRPAAEVAAAAIRQARNDALRESAHKCMLLKQTGGPTTPGEYRAAILAMIDNDT